MLLDRNKNLKVIFVGGKYNGQEIIVKDLIHLPEFVEFDKDLSVSRNKGVLVKRAELDSLPIIEGYTSMWNGDSIRYESWEVYNSMWD